MPDFSAQPVVQDGRVMLHPVPDRDVIALAADNDGNLFNGGQSLIASP
jgi:hypothetical protein